MNPTLLSPCLKASDLEETVWFYTELLGFRVETLWPPDDPHFAVLDHGPSENEVSVSLMFYTRDMIDGEPAPMLTGQLSFDVKDVLGLYERLEDEVEILWGPEVYHYGRREFSIADPNGYRLVFSEPTDDQPDCDDGFDDGESEDGADGVDSGEEE